MASQGPRSAGAGANQTGVGTVAWSFTGNIVADDGSSASSGTLTSGAQTNYLVASTFGFSIPAGSTIDGIVVEIKRSDLSSSDNIRDNRIRIVKGGSIQTTDKATATAWPASFAPSYASYGGSSDLWGTAWTAEDVNANDFGVAISARSLSVKGFRSAAVDHVRITVYYTEGTTTTTTTTTTPAPSSTPRRQSISLASGIRL